jgi:hypothetical protein
MDRDSQTTTGATAEQNAGNDQNLGYLITSSTNIIISFIQTDSSKDHGPKTYDRNKHGNKFGPNGSNYNFRLRHGLNN